MSNPPPTPPTLWERITNTLYGFWTFVRGLIDAVWRFAAAMPAYLLQAVFAINRPAGWLRTSLIVFGGLFTWVAFTNALVPLRFWKETGDSFAAIFTGLLGGPNVLLTNILKTIIYGAFATWDTIPKMFSPVIFRHVLAVVAPFLIALRIAVMYMADIYDQEVQQIAAADRKQEGLDADEEILFQQLVAFKFILRSVTGLNWDRITIAEGRAEPQDSTILQIGGPGWVQVNLENLAIFETVDGTPLVLGPSQGGRVAQALPGFARLREVIDLRNQASVSTPLSITARTREGIRVTAEGIRVRYSVLRNQAPDLPPNTPYSYNQANILSLVYNRSRNTRSWFEVLTQNTTTELRTFISTRTLSEFLAATSMVEEEARAEQQQAVEARRDDIETNAVPNEPALDGPLPTQAGFQPRMTISQDFFNPNPPAGFLGRQVAQGLNLDWIDVGTWRPSETITNAFLEARRLSVENEFQRRSMDFVEPEARLSELVRLIRETPLLAYRRSTTARRTEDETRMDIISAYLGLLRAARTTYESTGEAVPQELDAAIINLSNYLVQ
ncbi:MAG TPA: SPFH domain-containing protein [Anaerolineaceae bacterium]|nr:SPFH domain-containing protein [Anaerolineaceae bacterium]HPN51460.1 SPFH domain-containing protein [Anaerolineaceae bacterium]